MFLAGIQGGRVTGYPTKAFGYDKNRYAQIPNRTMLAVISNTVKDIIAPCLWGAAVNLLDLKADKFLIIERVLFLKMRMSSYAFQKREGVEYLFIVSIGKDFSLHSK